MAGGADGGEEPRVQGFVGGEVVVGGAGALGDNVFVGGTLAQAHTEADALAKALAVVGIFEISVIEGGLLVRVGGGEPQVAGARGEGEGAGDSDAAIGQILAGDGVIDGGGEEGHVVGGGGVAGGVAGGEADGVGAEGKGDAVTDAEGDAGVGVVGEVLADGGGVMGDGDADGAEVVGGADAGEEEEVWGAEAAGGEDDFAALDGELLTGAFGLDGHGALVVDDNAGDEDVGPDGEVEAVAGWSEVGEGSAHSDAVWIVHG